ncbi:hypothetical protein INT45_013297 [Circinella minor]|uniref:Uncharacterized protein n=1 Tax=Circinella minor TaxID=1195481 RepID=A0A8H7S336_9FUNG|nr:hypothetical protein INT45_013297 [Circinella minor]
MQKRFYPSQGDLYWAEKTVGEILELYYYHYDVNNKTEADLVRRLYIFFMFIGEKVSVSSSNRMNENRSAPGVTPLLRKKTGTKVDILIKHLYDDFGVGEAGLGGGATSTKYIKEANLKLLKSLKDVAWNLLKMRTKDTQQLRIPGFIINGILKLFDMIKMNL